MAASVPECVYLAADFARREEIRQYAAALREQGYTITASWLSKDTDSSKEGVTDSQRADWAAMESHDVESSDYLVLFTTGELARGGRHTEYGMALGFGVEVFIVGPAEHIFHHLAAARVDTFEQLLEQQYL